MEIQHKSFFELNREHLDHPFSNFVSKLSKVFPNFRVREEGREGGKERERERESHTLWSDVYEDIHSSMRTHI
jgi:hypothetical protein